MKTRTLVAIPVGIILGCALGFSVRNMGYTALVPVLLGIVINPLIVYGIAERRAIWVSVVPNVALVLTIEVLERYRMPDRMSEILSLLLALIVVAIIALVATAPSYWVRNRAVKTVTAEEAVKAAKVKGGKRQQNGNPFV
jgi:predicted Na+-dependent transporter